MEDSFGYFIFGLTAGDSDIPEDSPLFQQRSDSQFHSGQQPATGCRRRCNGGRLCVVERLRLAGKSHIAGNSIILGTSVVISIRSCMAMGPT